MTKTPSPHSYGYAVSRLGYPNLQARSNVTTGDRLSETSLDFFFSSQFLIRSLLLSSHTHSLSTGDGRRGLFAVGSGHESTALRFSPRYSAAGLPDSLALSRGLRGSEFGGGGRRPFSLADEDFNESISLIAASQRPPSTARTSNASTKQGSISFRTMIKGEGSSSCMVEEEMTTFSLNFQFKKPPGRAERGLEIYGQLVTISNFHEALWRKNENGPI
ncbi:hypothetical protein AKJ16_DCAP11076 [Drosera capensis]